MRSRFIGLSAAVIALLAAAEPSSALPTEPSGSWVYGYMDELRLSCDSLSLFVMSLPYERNELGNALSRAALRDGPGRARSEYLKSLLDMELAVEAAWKSGRENLFVGELTSGLAARRGERAGLDNLVKLNFYFAERLALWTYLRLTVSYPEAHRTETRTWGDYFRAGFDHGGLGFKAGRFSLFAGRDELAWGVTRDRGLMACGRAPAMDMLKLTYLEEKVLFTSVHSGLRRGEEDPWEMSVNRYISLHRLDLKLWPAFTVAVSEAVLYGGEHRGFEPAYLNPVSVFYAEQWNSGNEDNVLFSGDFSWLMPGAAEIRGEVLVDDFQYDFDSPHEYGFGLDFNARNPLVGLYSLLGCSYFHLRNGTYGHKVEYNRYTHESSIIGYPCGPDGDFLEFRLAMALPEEALWTVRASRRRQGEGRADDPQDGTEDVDGFLSGVVEKTVEAGLAVSWRPSYCWLLEGELGWYSVSNLENTDGSDDDGIRAALSVAFNFKRDYRRE